MCSSDLTKWIEVMLVPRQTAQAAIKFIEGIVYRFGVPNRVITDNGTQFTSRAFLNFYEEMGIKVCFASVSYPISNGQVERANAEVLKGLKTKAFNKLEDKGKKLIDHLPSILWSLRTTPSRTTGETPFFLVYGAEVVLPTVLKHGSPQVLAYDEDTQEERRIDDINLLEESRFRASLR